MSQPGERIASLGRNPSAEHMKRRRSWQGQQKPFRNDDVPDVRTMLSKHLPKLEYPPVFMISLQEWGPLGGDWQHAAACTAHFLPNLPVFPFRRSHGSQEYLDHQMASAILNFGELNNINVTATDVVCFQVYWAQTFLCGTCGWKVFVCPSWLGQAESKSYK